MSNYFKIHSQIDENTNNRIFLFHNSDNEIKEKIEILSISKEDEIKYARENHTDLRHLFYFNDYLNNNYLDDANIQKYNKKAQERDTLVFFMTLLKKDLIFMETTSLKDKKKSGIICLPDIIDDIQLDNFNKYKDYFKKFDSLIITGEFFVNEYSMVDSKLNEAIKGEDISEVYNIVEKYHNGNEKIKTN